MLYRLASRITPLLIVGVLIVGCASADPAGGVGSVETVVDTVAGVEHVRNAGAAPEWPAELVVRIGSETGGPDEFGRIGSVLADGDGNVYVADVSAYEIRVFAPDGSHLRTIGRQGSGPGEFRDLYSLAWVGGNLAALDPGNARITVFTPQGEWVRDTRHYPLTGPADFVRLWPLGDEGFYSRILDMEYQRTPVVRTVATGDLDTLDTPRLQPGENRGAAVCHRPDGGITGISLPQSFGLAFAFPTAGERIAVARTEAYAIATTNSAGDTLRMTTRERVPIPYPDELWEEGVKPFNELRERFPGLRCEPASLERPAHRAALRHILFDEAGRMWAEAASSAGFEWEVFDPSGRLLGAAPGVERVASIPPYVRDGMLYQVEAGELGEQSVAVYRIGTGGLGEKRQGSSVSGRGRRGECFRRAGFRRLPAAASGQQLPMPYRIERRSPVPTALPQPARPTHALQLAMPTPPPIHVIGGGLAGSEAAWQLAERGHQVLIHEMRPVRGTAAHKTDRLGELVCSNTFKSTETSNAHGLLKAEMRSLGCMLLECADEARVAAGSALAVDRDVFAAAVTERVSGHRLIETVRAEVTDLPDVGIVATGPLTSDALASTMRARLGVEGLAFYDAIAPIVSLESIDQSIVFRASRYGKETMEGAAEEGAYLNCPFTREEYEAFIDALVAADQYHGHEFDEVPYFEGCMPAEEMAGRGRDTLRFGPMKPVGLIDPRTGQRPWAVLQLRMEDRAGRMWNLVGFQTRLRIPEQQRVFRMIPGLADADFLRYGSIHRNSYLNTPAALLPHLALRDSPTTLFAGQITGVEGYTESTATGLLAGVNLSRMLSGEPVVLPPATTMLGALYRYLREADPRHFQPMNANFGLVDDLPNAPRDKRRRREAIAERALREIAEWRDEHMVVTAAR